MSSKISVVSWNMHKGRDCWGRQGMFEHSFKALDNQQWDLCLLQEVDGHEVLAFAGRQGYSVCYGYTRSNRGLHYGNAIVAREYELSCLANVDISAHRVESRRALICSAQKMGCPSFVCVSTHFGLKKKWRTRQGHSLMAGLAMGAASQPVHAPIVIGGDFNDHGHDLRIFMTAHGYADGSMALRPGDGVSGLGRPKTFPAQFPMLALDNIFSKGFHQGKIDLLAPHANWRSLSDHLPLEMKLRL